MWIPMLDGDERELAVDAMKLVHVTPQYWDGKQTLGTTLAESFGEQGPVWDAYLSYPAGALWTAAAPPHPEKLIAQVAGVVIGSPGTLPPAPDQTGLPPRLEGRAIVVGEQENLEQLLGAAFGP